MRTESAAAIRKQELTPPLTVVLASVAAAIVATVWSWSTHSMLLYGDARAHLNVARRVTD